MATAKEQIEEHLKLMVHPRTGVLKTARGDNAPELGQIFVWQETCAYAQKQLEQAWKAAVEAGVVPPEDELRARGEGEHIVAEDQRFSCIAKLTKPRAAFNRDAFLALIAKKFKIALPKLLPLVDQSMVPGKAALTKRVLEAS